MKLTNKERERQANGPRAILKMMRQGYLLRCAQSIFDNHDTATIMQLYSRQSSQKSTADCYYRRRGKPSKGKYLVNGDVQDHTTDSMPEFLNHDILKSTELNLLLLEISIHSARYQKLFNFGLWFDYYHGSKNPGMEPVV